AAAVLLEQVVDGGDVGMAERRRRTRFVDEAGITAGVLGGGGELLDGDRAAEHGVLGTIDGRHAAAADNVADVVAAGENAIVLDRRFCFVARHTAILRRNRRTANY